MIRFEKPIIKKASEMERGDIFRTEYGDYGNWCEFVFESYKMHDKNCIETTYHRIGEKQSKKCYGFIYNHDAEYKVIGKE